MFLHTARFKDLLGTAERRQQHGRQDGDDGDDQQQLDQRERMCYSVIALLVGSKYSSPEATVFLTARSQMLQPVRIRIEYPIEENRVLRSQINGRLFIHFHGDRSLTSCHRRRLNFHGKELQRCLDSYPLRYFRHLGIGGKRLLTGNYSTALLLGNS